ncbi:family 43 glycosylhydrolase [candidate division KSB1 bacterium]|nr:family 43 glycosylhydrolase [candidate division KSB1 bacterium]
MRLIRRIILLILCCQAFQLIAQKPILPDFHADPSAHVWEDTVWVFPSHDIAGSTFWDMKDWHVFSSTDLVNWMDHGVIFSLQDITWADRWAWAPDAAQRNGKTYFYYPADDQIGVAVADHPAGPFQDLLSKALISRDESDTRVMDPCIFMDEDGQALLYFGQNFPRVVKLKEDMITRDGEIIELEIENFHEGLWVHKYNGKYYMTYCSHTKTGELHSKLEYAMGDSPYGPFEYKGEFMDNLSRNVHHSIVQIGEKWILFYHVQGPSWFERRVCAEELKYNPDGTIQTIKMTEDGISALRIEH